MDSSARNWSSVWAYRVSQRGIQITDVAPPDGVDCLLVITGSPVLSISEDAHPVLAQLVWQSVQAQLPNIISNAGCNCEPFANLGVRIVRQATSWVGFTTIISDLLLSRGVVPIKLSSCSRPCVNPERSCLATVSSRTERYSFHAYPDCHRQDRSDVAISLLLRIQRPDQIAALRSQ